MSEQVNKPTGVDTGKPSPSLPEQAQEFVTELLNQRPNNYVYHNLRHTESVVAAAGQLAREYGLNDYETNLILVAAWFHDAAYSEGPPEGHEVRSAKIARHFLEELQTGEQEIAYVEQCIMATEMKSRPETLPEMILKDADCAHLADKKFRKSTELLRMEWELVDGKSFTEKEWLLNNIDFLENHHYYTTIARSDWETEKRKHLRRLKKDLATLEFVGLEAAESQDDLFDNQNKRYSRGVDTMYRVTLRNHIHLSRIADNKANFLLSICAIILSLLLGNLITDNKPVASMLLPSIYFLLVCIVTMILAILASRPNVTEGKFSRDALLAKKTNILFFGNFHSMSQDEFNWGMDQLVKNQDLLYHSLTTDLYFLGKVLHKKYKYLRAAFHVFMFGLISTALFYLFMLLA